MMWQCEINDLWYLEIRNVKLVILACLALQHVLHVLREVNVKRTLQLNVQLVVTHCWVIQIVWNVQPAITVHVLTLLHR